MNLYITTQGAYVKKVGNTIVVEKDHEKIVQHPIKNISMLILFGNIQVTIQAMLTLQKHGCDIAMMSKNGHFRGKMSSAYSKNVTFRLAQHKRYSDIPFRLKFAQQIVYSKIENGLNLLKKYHYNPNNPAKFNNLSLFKKNLAAISKTNDLNELRGHEGYAAKQYFKALSECFTVDNISFTGRTYYPSPDPINALLSFGYSFVARELQAILDACGFDPYIGFFHEVHYGRASLSLDLLEEFRHSVVDKLVLKLINKRILTTDDFFKDEKKGGCYLNRESLNIFIHHFEQIADTDNISYGDKTNKISYRKIFWNQVEKLKKAVLDGTDYHPHSFGSEQK